MFLLHQDHPHGKPPSTNGLAAVNDGDPYVPFAPLLFLATASAAITP